MSGLRLPGCSVRSRHRSHKPAFVQRRSTTSRRSLDLSGTIVLPRAVTMRTELFGADPSSLCVTGAFVLLRVFTAVRAMTWLCMDNGRTRPSMRSARRKRSFVLCSHLSVRPRIFAISRSPAVAGAFLLYRGGIFVLSTSERRELTTVPVGFHGRSPVHAACTANSTKGL